MKKDEWRKYIGKKFNSLTVLDIKHLPDKNGDLKINAVCKCDCGSTVTRSVYNIISGKAKTCGCGRKNSPDTKVGDVYGRLTVISQDDTINGLRRWRCKCSCGNEGVFTEKSLRAGKRTTCGHCVPIAKPGEKYGNLTVLEDLGTVDGSTGNFRIRGIKCRCDCGNITIVPNSILVKGRTKSCGCMTALNPKDPRSNNPLIKELYGRSVMIIDRCTNPWSPSFKNYGGRGIKCMLGDQPWDVAESLSKIPGYFKGAAIDRIDNNGDYSADNLRWVTTEDNTLNSSIIQHMSKEVLSSRLLSETSAQKHMKRISTNSKDFNVYEFAHIPCYENEKLLLCVHKDISSTECISKIREHYNDHGYEIPYEHIKKIKINK